MIQTWSNMVQTWPQFCQNMVQAWPKCGPTMIQNTCPRAHLRALPRAPEHALAHARTPACGWVDLRTLVAPHYKTRLTRLMGRNMFGHVVQNLCFIALFKIVLPKIGGLIESMETAMQNQKLMMAAGGGGGHFASYAIIVC
jgi:hypothetical protein